MPLVEYDFKALFGSEQFKDFGYIDAEQSLRVVYPLATQQFPIGYISDKNTPEGQGRDVINQTLGTKFGLIYHLRLSFNDDRNSVIVVESEPEDVIKQLGGRQRPSVSYDCGGLIIPRNSESPFVVETFVGDCACIVVRSDRWIGYMHVGRPEIMAELNLIENFFKLWPAKAEETRVWVGPCIGGSHYELSEIPEKFKAYTIQTIWYTQGFDLMNAISDQISASNKIEDIRQTVTVERIDPFLVNGKFNDHSWAASDQWYRRKGKELGFPIFSPRNSAMLFVEG